MYDELIKLIEESGVAFGPFGDGASETAISRAEGELRITFSRSFRWWLHNYNLGQIGADILNGIDECKDGVWCPDIVELAKSNWRSGFYEPHEVVFYTGNEECFL